MNKRTEEYTDYAVFQDAFDHQVIVLSKSKVKKEDINFNYFYYDCKVPIVSQCSYNVIYIEQDKSITISCHPEYRTTLKWLGHPDNSQKQNPSYQTTVAGIQFFGHEKMAETEQGVNYTFEDAKRIFEALKAEEQNNLEFKKRAKMISF